MARLFQSRPDPLKDHHKYEKIKDLSHGTFGFVQLCRVRNTEEIVAIKFLERGPGQSKYVETEVLNHRMLRHPHVVEFKEVFLTKDHICITMEYADGGTLLRYITRKTKGYLMEAEARWFFQQLIVALDYCHRKGVVNRDVKLENTLLCSLPGLPLPLLKVCDFGYSKAHFMSAPKSKVGTLAYMAPEVIHATERYDGKLADIWSCGVMLYVMLFGRYPFDAREGPRVNENAPAKNEEKAVGLAAGQQNNHNNNNVAEAKKAQANGHLINRILQNDWSIPPGASISPDCEDLLRRLLEVDLPRRLRMPDILNHRWFLVNLPEGVLHMNDGFLQGEGNQNVSGLQTVDDIVRVIAAGAEPGSPRKPPEERYEDLIAKTIDDVLEGAETQGIHPQAPFLRPPVGASSPARPAPLPGAGPAANGADGHLGQSGVGNHVGNPVPQPLPHAQHGPAVPRTTPAPPQAPLIPIVLAPPRPSSSKQHAPGMAQAQAQGGSTRQAAAGQPVASTQSLVNSHAPLPHPNAPLPHPQPQSQAQHVYHPNAQVQNPMVIASAPPTYAQAHDHAQIQMQAQVQAAQNLAAQQHDTHVVAPIVRPTPGGAYELCVPSAQQPGVASTTNAPVIPAIVVPVAPASFTGGHIGVPLVLIPNGAGEVAAGTNPPAAVIVPTISPGGHMVGCGGGGGGGGGGGANHNTVNNCPVGNTANICTANTINTLGNVTTIHHSPNVSMSNVNASTAIPVVAVGVPSPPMDQPHPLRLHLNQPEASASPYSHDTSQNYPSGSTSASTCTSFGTAAASIPSANSTTCAAICPSKPHYGVSSPLSIGGEGLAASAAVPSSSTILPYASSPSRGGTGAGTRSGGGTSGASAVGGGRQTLFNCSSAGTEAVTVAIAAAVAGGSANHPAATTGERFGNVDPATDPATANATAALTASGPSGQFSGGLPSSFLAATSVPNSLGASTAAAQFLQGLGGVPSVPSAGAESGNGGVRSPYQSSGSHHSVTAAAAAASNTIASTTPSGSIIVAAVGADGRGGSRATASGSLSQTHSASHHSVPLAGRTSSVGDEVGLQRPSTLHPVNSLSQEIINNNSSNSLDTRASAQFFPHRESSASTTSASASASASASGVAAAAAAAAAAGITGIPSVSSLASASPSSLPSSLPSALPLSLPSALLALGGASVSSSFPSLLGFPSLPPGAFLGQLSSSGGGMQSSLLDHLPNDLGLLGRPSNVTSDGVVGGNSGAAVDQAGRGAVGGNSSFFQSLPQEANHDDEAEPMQCSEAGHDD